LAVHALPTLLGSGAPDDDEADREAVPPAPPLDDDEDAVGDPPVVDALEIEPPDALTPLAPPCELHAHGPSAAATEASAIRIGRRARMLRSAREGVALSSAADARSARLRWTRRASVASSLLMIRKASLLAPLVLALGCSSPPASTPPQPSAAPPAASAPPPEAPPTVAPAAPAAAGDKKPADAAAAPRPSAAASSMPPMLTKITQDDILAAVNKNGEAFNRCYTIGAGGSKSFRAKVTVKATVGPTGSVNTVEIVSSTAKNAKVDACVVDAFKKLTFNRPEGSGATVFTFPLNFEGLEQVQ
jgi:TonB family protein